MKVAIDENNAAHYKTYISSSDTDSFYTTRLSEYQSLVQEAGALHADFRHVGIPDIQPLGKTWVIARSRMEIFYYGKWKDGVNVKTWAQKPAGLNCPRVVEASDDNGRKLFHAMTRWAIIDYVNGRPVRPTDIIEAIIPCTDVLAEDTKMPNLVEYRDECQTLVAKIKPAIHYLDTDYNHHVNNRSYVNWCLEALSDEFMDTYKADLMDVRWARQTYRKDKLEVRVFAPQDGEFTAEEPRLFFEIYKLEEDGETLVFDAYSEWKRRELLSDPQ